MFRERIAWVIGTVSCVLLALRLVNHVPVDEEDRDFSQIVAQVEHEVRANYVDEITPDRLRAMQNAGIAGMLSTLDPHTIYVPPAGKQQFMQAINGNFIGIGVVLRAGDKPGEIAVTTPIEGGPAYAAGVEAGDVFVKVNGESVAGLSREELQARVQGPPGTTVNVTFRRFDGTEKAFLVERRQVNVPTVTGYQREADGSWDYFADRSVGIGYLRISQFNEDTGEEVKQALNGINGAGAKSVIIDLRYNGGGRLDEAVKIADYFLDSGLIVRVKGRMRPESSVEAKPGDTIFHGPVVLLVNGDTASASEILSGALADHHRATVVGTRTYGKGSVQEVENWGEDGALKITIARYYLPSGRCVDRLPDATVWGIDPSVPVQLNEWQEQAVAMQLAMPSVIPPKSHPTTLPTRTPDVQLEQAMKTAAALMVRPTTEATH